MTVRKLFLTLFCTSLISITAPPSMAQNTAAEPSGEPVEITADQSLEWNRSKQVFVATKNAKAVQGESAIAAETLTAHYRDGAKSDLEIYELKARGQVKITNQDNTAYGERATYDLDKGLATLTGGDLRLVSPNQTITAQEHFEYWVTDGRVIAKGRPRVTRPKIGGGTDTLESNEMVATLVENTKGQRVVETLEAQGNVVITTPTEVVTGAYGIFRSATNKAELSGGVTIKRGPNILEGERAEVDLTTNISELFGSNLPGGRVRGVFFPNSDKKQKTPPAQEKTPVPLRGAVPGTAPTATPAPATIETPVQPTSQGRAIQLEQRTPAISQPPQQAAPQTETPAIPPLQSTEDFAPLTRP